MATSSVPYFKNDIGVKIIEIGVHEFKCAGTSPPFDHPHIFLDMGNEDKIICPYCSTLYQYRAELHADQSNPPECILDATDNI
jgi:uncharacterized Zn-finger protein